MLAEISGISVSLTHLQVADQIWSDEAIVEALELITHRVIAGLTHHIL